ncbi:hypothetical protein S245_067483 [Arachis hypogaea]
MEKKGTQQQQDQVIVIEDNEEGTGENSERLNQGREMMGVLGENVQVVKNVNEDIIQTASHDKSFTIHRTSQTIATRNKRFKIKYLAMQEGTKMNMMIGVKRNNDLEEDLDKK